MGPGLVSEGGHLDDDLEEGDPVAIMAQDKKHAMGVGFMLKSGDALKAESKGMAIEVIEFLNDSVWKDIR